MHWGFLSCDRRGAMVFGASLMGMIPASWPGVRLEGCAEEQCKLQYLQCNSNHILVPSGGSHLASGCQGSELSPFGQLFFLHARLLHGHSTPKTTKAHQTSSEQCTRLATSFRRELATTRSAELVVMPRLEAAIHEFRGMCDAWSKEREKG